MNINWISRFEIRVYFVRTDLHGFNVDPGRKDMNENFVQWDSRMSVILYNGNCWSMSR